MFKFSATTLQAGGVAVHAPCFEWVQSSMIGGIGQFQILNAVIALIFIFVMDVFVVR